MAERIVANGIDARTGAPLLDIDLEELTQRVQGVGDDLTSPQEALGLDARRALPFTVDPTDLAAAGWSIVFASNVDAAVRAALEPLIQHRRSGIPRDNLHVHEHHAGEEVIDWLARHDVNPGSVDPSRVGYYVLLVGPPSGIPFEFQYLLNVEYGVGRIDFDAPEDYRSYAESVVAHEQHTAAGPGATVGFWGPRHDGDPATKLSSAHLMEPLIRGAEGGSGLAERYGCQPVSRLGAEATKQALLDLLSGASEAGRPRLLVTASHGLGGLPPGDPEQHRRHGALVTQDWQGGPPDRDVTLGGDDLGEAQVQGSIAFLFACFGAGTPQSDDFSRMTGGTPPLLATEPFVAHLAQRLLAHSAGGALAVIGHVDRAWGYSIVTSGGRQLRRFEDVLGQLLSGRPAGHAMKVFRDADSVLANALLNDVRRAQRGATVSPRRLLDLWLERTDARNYVLLGDPAVSLSV